jgi:hypothetical protein
VWYWWTKVQRAGIPTDRRVQFEQLGEPVVAQIVGQPFSRQFATGQTVGIPEWAATDTDDRQHAFSWLREQHSRHERRQDISEAVEIAILVLVAIEAIPILLGIFSKR